MHKSKENPIEYRTAEIKFKRAEAENAELFSLSFSSDLPYERFWGIEILDHNADSIRMERITDGAAVLVDHGGDQVGVVEEAFVNNEKKRLEGKIRFSGSERGREIRQDVIDGIRRNVSIGYAIHNLELEEKGNDGAPDKFRVTDWEPFEVSIVSVPADPSVGFGRASEKLIKSMVENILPKKLKVDIKTNMGNSQMEELTNKEDVLKAERNRIAEIEGLEKLHNLDLSKHKANGASIEDVRGFVLSEIGNKPLEKPKDLLDMNQGELKRYDLLKAVRAMANPKMFEKEAGFEIEISQEIATRLNKSPNGLYVPMDVFKRDLTTGGSTSGSELVGTDHMSFIELLRNKMLALKLGAKTMSGLVGNVSIPRWDGAATAAWVSTEGAGAAESTPTTGSLSLTDHEVSANVQYSRALMLQSSPAVGDLVKDDLMQVLALAIDNAVFHGSGASGQPQGIVGTTGVGAVALASATWAKMVEFESDVDTGNALEGNLNYVTTPSIRGTLKSRAKESGYPVYICSDDNKINGYDAHSTNQISSGYAIFGNFAQIILAEWGGLDILAEQDAATGKFTIGAFKTVDVGVRQPAAFSVGSSFS